MYEYIRAKALFKYHSEGGSPWPIEAQEMFASALLKKIKSIEADMPCIIEEYEEYIKRMLDNK